MMFMDEVEGDLTFFKYNRKIKSIFYMNKVKMKALGEAISKYIWVEGCMVDIRVYNRRHQSYITFSKLFQIILFINHTPYI